MYSKIINRRQFVQKITTQSLALYFSSNFLTSCSKAKKILFDKSILVDIQLPLGFQYKLISIQGEKLTNGYLVPPRHDGMGLFMDGENYVLVRNHEIAFDGSQAQNYAYDPSCNGGTTTVVIDQSRNVIGQYLTSTGMSQNCSGGCTPWKSWITCEETTIIPGDTKDGYVATEKHGYAFEILSNDFTIKKRSPLVAMGRFTREAVAFDLKNEFIYQTEDKDDACFYRFKPNSYGKLIDGGRLQALCVDGLPVLNTSITGALQLGVPVNVSWVDIDEPDPVEDSVRLEAQQKGAAFFSRTEGLWPVDDGAYFCATTGGDEKLGQIFKYYYPTQTSSEGRLELVFQSTDESVLHNPDAVCLSPWGDLFVCEDKDTPYMIKGIKPSGQVYGFSSSPLGEWAGLNFSPDGKYLFANLQNLGATVMIWGPWEQFSV